MRVAVNITSAFSAAEIARLVAGAVGSIRRQVQWPSEEQSPTRRGLRVADRYAWSALSWTLTVVRWLVCAPTPGDGRLLIRYCTSARDPPSLGQALKSVFRVLRPGGILAVHEHLPDPDIIWPKRLRRIVAAEEFRFHRQTGMGWRYTALFKKPELR